ncbi:putative modifier of rudimentary (Mod(r)) protein [Lyophyllum shimeji]|uniref:Modifier of rudimentary (Mod(R)) protein n=1 Tax=Lyophyllum shimeji TaxID=47721 RepID=A0A9P3PLZ6_LYOSH|nr:putative modifier of rudimentary (Mod(r)) protein [Lyophyllum shimeji]
MATPLLQEFPELSHLSREDLEDLLVDPMYFQAIFYSLDRVKALYQTQAELGMANESIANSNLRLQESLYKLRSETQEAFDEAKALESRWKEVEKEQRDVYQRFTPQFLLMRLRHSTIAQDDASEALATAFIQQQQQPSSNGTAITTPNGAMGVDEFIKEFKELRKVYHKRAMWAERIWRNLIAKPSPALRRTNERSTSGS